MRIYFSGRNDPANPEQVILHRKPNIMVSFAYLTKKGKGRGSDYGRLKKIVRTCSGQVNLFIDSGAFTLYIEECKKRGGSYDYFNLKRGSRFRAYCDSYATFLKKFGDRGISANVDVIYHPKKTWETQQYFFKEHGLRLIPVFHYGSDLKHLDCYIEDGYDFVGLGGMAWGAPGINRWIDRVFYHIRNDSIRVHGFALTSWGRMVRWPWYSVDSSTWLRVGAYGGIFIPAREKGKWVYSKPPFMVKVTTEGKNRRDQSTIPPIIKGIMTEWLNEYGLEQEQLNHFSKRNVINLNYLKNLEEHIATLDRKPGMSLSPTLGL